MLGGAHGDGALYVQFGPFSGPLQVGEADVRLRGEPRALGHGGLAGLALAAGADGDGDGDGADDIHVGAPYLAIAGASDGRVYFVSAPEPGAGLLADAAATLDGEPSDHAGWSIAWAGESNADGYEDALAQNVPEATWG